MLSKVSSLIAVKDDRRGIAAIEYALIASLMCVILVALFPTLKTALVSTFTTISTHLTSGT